MCGLSLEKPHRFAWLCMAKQRRLLAWRSLMLAGEIDTAGAIAVEMANGQLVQGWRQGLFFCQGAVNTVDTTQGRFHCRKIELGPDEVRVGFNATIGDCKRSSVSQHHQIMGPDTARRKFANFAEVMPDVVDTDHSICIGKIILCRIEQSAVGRKYAMAKIMAVGCCLNTLWWRIRSHVEGNSNGAGSPGKDHGISGFPVADDVMAAYRQCVLHDDVAVFGHQRKAVAA